MRKSVLLATLAFLFFYNSHANAQLSNIINAVTANRDSIHQDTLAVSKDSVKILEMQQALEEARINEMNLRMEMEQLRFATVITDSLRKAESKQRIDSLRSITVATPVVVEGDTLYYIYSRRGGVSPRERAASVTKMVLSLGKQFSLNPDSVYIESTDITTELMYKDKVIASFTDLDGLWENTTRDELASERRLIIVNKLYELQKEYGLMQLLKRVFFFVLVIAIQILLIWGTVWLYRRGKLQILRLRDSRLKAISIRDYELFDTQKQVRILTFFANLVKYVLIFIQLIFSIPIIFSIFPQTEDLAYKIFSYIWNPIKKIGISVIDYIPNLFTIIIIWLAIRYLVKGVGYLANEIQSEKLKISGFYPDWAHPTYQIVRFLLYAFMIAMVYQYLPGSDSGIFQGVSVFVGLIVSLGSSSVIGNIMAGLVITYMRPFKIGDRIKLNDTVGNVMEKTPFVTRIKTPKNEIVTIPNSFIMSSHTVNYSSSARDYGLIIHSEVSFGFEIHWKIVHDLLIAAALKTPGVSEEPKPFVLETSLHDFYVMYQINAYIKDANKLAQIYSDLHQNIMDGANEAGIELLSPHYYAKRDGSETTIPKEYQEKEINK
ncbi:mechanosensitive ion channel family protein [Bacteroides sp. 51]|uniref:mechanosensitive ion channel family protein n=1 Tax=Bacteroides sp. 51 TaxID=2302938 RepID=UPI0013D08724|nr:mechanosensitive ion channel domain-containing protein [Bacteroides sp. 51]NDV80649.1 mechanosensitive ion channel family protein [Bacteroides sp. 51]